MTYAFRSPYFVLSCFGNPNITPVKFHQNVKSQDLAVSMHNAQEDGDLYDRMQDVYMEVGWAQEVIDFLETLSEEQYTAAIKELSTVRESLEWISAAYVVDPE